MGSGTRNQHILGSEIEAKLLALQAREAVNAPKKSGGTQSHDTFNVEMSVDKKRNKLVIEVDLTALVPDQPLVKKNGKARTSLTVARTRYDNPYDKGELFLFPDGREGIVDLGVFRRVKR